MSKRTYLDFDIRSGFLEGISRLAVDVGARSINERDGNVRWDLANPLQHGPFGPTIRNGHVPEGRLTAETQKYTLVSARWLWQRDQHCLVPAPRSLNVQVVDVVGDGVVLECRRVFLLEVGPDCLNQHWA